MFVNSDFSELLRLFNANQVRYLVIGGYALIQYAEPRYTKDLDLWISTDAINAKAVYRALREFGAPLADLTEADFSQEGYFYQMGAPPVRVDILMGIPGVAFEEAWPKRTTVDFDGLAVAFIAREDLIMAKRAAGRPQDLLDAELLSQVQAKSPKRRRAEPTQSKAE
jgi:predicted nucleotidyltransferase